MADPFSMGDRDPSSIAPDRWMRRLQCACRGAGGQRILHARIEIHDVERVAKVTGGGPCHPRLFSYPK
ncbi:hypothetical protein D5S18_30895 [Nocardia panacis]|uniref:Uncharacterized protein n=1 Tax=Nocardia panacis TaxID=2340916 RepID=A0A3A4K9G6_9NOCA|nr:hypothetical protein D5S18_30895 [Nocardia panacis]